MSEPQRKPPKGYVLHQVETEGEKRARLEGDKLRRIAEQQSLGLSPVPAIGGRAGRVTVYQATRHWLRSGTQRGQHVRRRRRALSSSRGLTYLSLNKEHLPFYTQDVLQHRQRQRSWSACVPSSLSRAWVSSEDPQPGHTIKEKMEGVLQKLGEVLERPSLAVGPSTSVSRGGSNPFINPLMEPSSSGDYGVEAYKAVCMQVDPSLVRNKEGLVMDNKGYVRVNLGWKDKKRVSEMAHRLVLWGIFGPPGWLKNKRVDSSEGLSLHCLHSCDNKLCLNPWHLVWGRPVDNKPTPTKPEVHRERMRERCVKMRAL